MNFLLWKCKLSYCKIQLPTNWQKINIQILLYHKTPKPLLKQYDLQANHCLPRMFLTKLHTLSHGIEHPRKAIGFVVLVYHQ